MGLDLGTLTVTLTAATAEFKKQMSEAQKAVYDFTKNLEPLAKGSAIAFAGLAGSIALVTKAAGEDLVNEMRLKSVFGENTEALIAYAEAQELSTVFSHDASIEAMKLMGTMGLNADQTKALLPSVQDLAALMGSDLSGAAMVAMRAIDNGSSALKRSGVTMTEQQKKTFDSLNTAGRLAMMMDLLGNKAGGMASKMATTVPGALEQIKNAMGSLVDELGMGFQDMAVTALSTLNEGLQGAVAWFKALSPEAKEFGAKIAVGAAAIAGVSSAVLGLAVALPTIIGLVESAGVGFMALGTIMTGAILPALPWILGIAAAIAGVILTVGLLRQAWDSNFLGIRDGIKSFIAWHVQTFTEGFAALGRLLDWFVEANYQMLDTIKAAWTGFINAHKDMISMLTLGKVSFEQSTWAPTQRGSVGGGIAGAASAVAGGVGSAAGAVGSFLGGAFGSGLDTVLAPIKAAFASLMPTMEALKTTTTSASKGLGGVALNAEALAKLEESRATAAAAVLEYEQNARQRAERLRESMPNMGGGSLDYGVTQGAGGGSAAADYASENKVKELMDKYRGGLRTLVKNITDGAETFGIVFAQTLAQKAGDVGEIVQAAMQGMQAGPWGAIAAVLMTLLAKTEAFKKLMDHANATVGKIIKSLEGLMEGIGPIVSLINDLIGMIFLGLTPVFKLLGQVLTYLYRVISWIVVGLSYFLLGVGTAWNWMIEGLASILDNLSTDLGDFVRRLKFNLNGVNRTIEEFTEKGEHGKWNESYDAAADEVESFDDGLGEANKTLKETSEELINVPSGYKIALARFNASDGVGAGDTGGGKASIGQQYNIEKVVVQANDPAEFSRQLEKQNSWNNYRGNGTTLTPAPAYSGG